MQESFRKAAFGNKTPSVCRTPLLHTYRSNPYGGHKSPLIKGSHHRDAFHREIRKLTLFTGQCRFSHRTPQIDAPSDASSPNVDFQQADEVELISWSPRENLSSLSETGTGSFPRHPPCCASVVAAFSIRSAHFPHRGAVLRTPLGGVLGLEHGDLGLAEGGRHSQEPRQTSPPPLGLAHARAHCGDLGHPTGEAFKESENQVASRHLKGGCQKPLATLGKLGQCSSRRSWQAPVQGRGAPRLLGLWAEAVSRRGSLLRLRCWRLQGLLGNGLSPSKVASHRPPRW